MRPVAKDDVQKQDTDFGLGCCLKHPFTPGPEIDHGMRTPDSIPVVAQVGQHISGGQRAAVHISAAAKVFLQVNLVAQLLQENQGFITQGPPGEQPAYAMF